MTGGHLLLPRYSSPTRPPVHALFQAGKVLWRVGGAQQPLRIVPLYEPFPGPVRFLLPVWRHVSSLVVVEVRIVVAVAHDD